MFLDPNQPLEMGMIQQGDLFKALTAGYGTDSAAYTGGRSLIPEDIEMSLINALTFNKQDFKLMNLIKREPVQSTVHEYTRETAVGAEQPIFVEEGGESEENTTELERVTKPVKYMQSFRKVTLQMRQARTLEDAESLEKTSGTLEILKGAEAHCFIGNGAVVPVQFVSIQNQILSVAAAKQNITDLRGKTMTTAEGETAFNELVRMIFENGGWATHSFMPPIISQDVQTLVKDRLRFNPEDRRGAMVVEAWPTAHSGEIVIAGQSAGPDKFFRVKGAITSVGGANKPNPPDSVTVTLQDKTGGTGFTAETQGDYFYAVYAISKDGISTATTPAGAAAPIAGKEVIVTITPAASNPGTGYIICRSKKDAADGTDVREMIRVPDSGEVTTVFLDRDDWLPGTGEMVLVSQTGMQATVQFDQFLPLMKFPLYPTKSAIIPFLVLLFGSLDVKVPWYHGFIKNIGYTGMNWF